MAETESERRERERREEQQQRDNERREATARRLSEYMGSANDPRPPWARD